jgi:peptidyl-prolyl cis-trans isomerase SurA
MLEIRELILNGQDFDEVAKQYSQDPSAAKNGGKIGYFKGLQMVYPFEEVAYSTAVGEVSMPFKTKFGYHILKVNDVRVSEGEVEAAHIMLNGDTEAVKQKIDSIYKVLLKNPADFEKLAETLSDDKSSAKNGGYLAKFDYGRMVEEFSKVAFSLQNPGDISKPFKTSYGWHIIKLIKKYPVESFEVLEPKISQQIKRSDRAVLSEKSVIDGLRKKYKIVVFEPALNQFETDDWKANPEKFQQKLLKIQELDIYQSQFIAFLNKNNFKTVNSAFKAFEEQEILNYYKQDIQTNNAEFLATYKEFEEGLLLFSMLESEVWEKSKDSVGLQNYYEANKNGIFKNKNLEDNKGFIVSEYQNYLENAWIEALHQKYNVEFVETEKKYIIESNLN